MVRTYVDRGHRWEENELFKNFNLCCAATGSKTARQWLVGTGRRRRPSCGPLLWSLQTVIQILLLAAAAAAAGAKELGQRWPLDVQLTWCKLSHCLASASALRSGVNIHVYDCYVAFSHLETHIRQLFGPQLDLYVSRKSSCGVPNNRHLPQGWALMQTASVCQSAKKWWRA